MPDERKLFEEWVKKEYPGRWPNPDHDGTYYNADGYYHNRALQQMWEAWQAAVETVVRGTLT